MPKTNLIRKLFDGRLRLETHNENPTIHARTYLQGKLISKSTAETSIVTASRVASDWYLGLLERVRKGDKLHAPTFAEVAQKFLVACTRDHNEGQVKNFKDKWSLLKPFIGDVKPGDIDTAFLADLRG